VTEHTVLHSSAQTRSDVLLKTAIGQVSSGNFTTEANILFDEGAQRPFITEWLANELHLKETGVKTVHVAAFGDSSQRVRTMRTATVLIITDRKEQVPIEVLITPTIAAPLQNLQRDASRLTYLRGLKLAHPITSDQMFNISLS